MDIAVERPALISKGLAACIRRTHKPAVLQQATVTSINPTLTQ